MDMEEEGGKEAAPTAAMRKRKASSPEAVADVRPSPRKKKAAKAVPSNDSPHSSPQTTPTKGAGKDKPVCKYGVKCYQKNPQHRKKYTHPWVREGGGGEGRERGREGGRVGWREGRRKGGRKEEGGRGVN